MQKAKNNILFLIYSILLGIIVGVIIWAFLRVMNLCISFLWEFIPSVISFPLYTLILCTAGGALIGLYKKKFGDYPEELGVVLKKVKKSGGYPYHNLFMILGAALFPLIIGASVGPEAGLTGVIAGLCTFIGDKLKVFKKETEELAKIGMSASLGTIFRSPMFGLIEPLESEKDTVLPRSSKIVLYLTAAVSSFGCFFLLNHFVMGGEGMPSMDFTKFDLIQLLYIIPFTLVGIFAGYLYFFFKFITASLKKKFEKYPIIRATAGGLLLGITGTLLPLTMYSGEHQIGIVSQNAIQIGAVMLIVVAVVKLLLTNICIDSGLKGGHFFPVIFCGIAIGCAMSLIFNVDMTLCACIVTSALVGHTLKKPLAVVLLLMIVFPIRLIPVMIICAVAAKFIPTPKFLLITEE